jgi:hypothetical protein
MRDVNQANRVKAAFCNGIERSVCDLKASGVVVNF